MRGSCKLLFICLGLYASLPTLPEAQALSISGTIVDSATMLGIPNAVVAIVESPFTRDTTDAYGNFILGGTPSKSIKAELDSRVETISLQGGTLTITGLKSSLPVTAEVFECNGKRIARIEKNAGANGSVSFANLRQTSGLHYVKIHVDGNEKIFTSFGGGNQQQSSTWTQINESGRLNKKNAAYTLSVSKIGIVSKQVPGVNEATSADTIKVKSVPAPRPVVPMPVISQNVPAYSSSSQSGAGPTLANDTNQNSVWSSTGGTGWLAYDLSSKPLAARQKVLVAWYDKNAMDYFFVNGSNLAKDYTIEINMAPGGGSAAPTTGWITVFAVTGNKHCARQHEINMNGANWIRINVSASHTAPVTLDMDVYDVSNGITDFWLIMGDSITFMSMQRSGNNLQNRVHQFLPTSWPGLVCAAEGGTSSWTGCDVIDDVLASFSGKFITLNYGTNDHSDTAWNGPNGGFFNRMDTLCTKIIAAGKTPVIPALPWPHTADSVDALVKLSQIQKLWAKYPTLVVPGPDLWTFFKNNPNLIAPGDVHPNAEGMENIRRMWVAQIDSMYQR